MSAIFVDEGIFLNFLVRDNDEWYNRSRILFEQAEAGREKLETNELVLNEVVRVLEERYALSCETIAHILEAVLGTRNLKIPERRVLKRAVESYASGKMKFVEAFNAAYALERGLRQRSDVLEEAVR